jgi:hypothetical protein
MLHFHLADQAHHFDSLFQSIKRVAATVSSRFAAAAYSAAAACVWGNGLPIAVAVPLRVQVSGAVGVNAVSGARVTSWAAGCTSTGNRDDH